MNWWHRLPRWDPAPDYFYVITPGVTRDQLDQGLDNWPFPVRWLDPWKVVSDPQGRKLIQTVLGFEKVLFPGDLATPGWAYYDTHLLNGFACGLAIRANHPLAVPIRLKAAQRGVNLDPQEDIPISHFVLVKHPLEKRWVAVNLWSVNGLLGPKTWPQLGFITKALGLQLAGYPAFWGVTQWKNPALRLHVQYGPTRLVTALMPLHTNPLSLTYECVPDPSAWLLPNRFIPWENQFNLRPDVQVLPWDDPSFEARLWEIQSMLESATERWYLMPTPVQEYFTSHQVLPLAQRG